MSTESLHKIPPGVNLYVKIVCFCNALENQVHLLNVRKRQRDRRYMEFCDLNCLHAEWPSNQALDGSASCRTFQAIFCKKKDKVVYKNGPCMEKERRPGDYSGRGAEDKKK